MLGEHPAMVGRGTATSIRRDPDFDPLAAVSPFARAADIALANLECPLSDWPRMCSPATRECRGPAAAAGILARSGFGAFTLANNHIQQHGPAAFDATVAALDTHGLAVVGRSGPERGTCLPVDLETGDRTIRLLGYSLRPRQHFTETPRYAEGTREGMLADVTAGREAGATVVVTIHWGDEFVATPSREQVDLGRALVDAGCTLVAGHHPHVLQGWERHGAGVILYSLGNLVFDMPWLPSLRRSALCEVELGPEGCGDVTWHPLILDERHRPRPAAGAEREEILEFLTAARRDLEAGAGPLAAPPEQEYQRGLAAAAAEERWTRNRYFLRNVLRYRPDVSGQLIGKFLLRRLGLLHD